MSPSSPRQPRPPRSPAEPPRLAEVVLLHSPTVADPVEAPEFGEQMALPLFFLIDGEGRG